MTQITLIKARTDSADVSVKEKVITDYTDSVDVSVQENVITDYTNYTDYTDYTDSADVTVTVQGRDSVAVTEAVPIRDYTDYTDYTDSQMIPNPHSPCPLSPRPCY